MTTPRVKLNLAGIPGELRTVRQWVLWKYERRKGEQKPTKVPYQPSGRRADSTDPATWSSFNDVLVAYLRGCFAGIGIMLANGLVGIDLDHVIDPATGEVSPWASWVIAELASYTEATPSGEGFHVLGWGTWPGPRHKTSVQQRGTVAEAIEGYSTARFFTFTGAHTDGTPSVLNDVTATAKTVYDGFLPSEQQVHATPHAPQPVALDDAALLEGMFSARNGDDVCRLWEGDTSGYGSHSEADLALVSHLVFWCGGDAARVDALFRRSALWREKWDQKRGSLTYGQRTISVALSGGREFYAPHAALAPRGHRVHHRTVPAFEVEL